MTRTQASYNLLRRFASFMNLTEQPKAMAFQRGESVAAAWSATGGYLRNAMNSYDSDHTKPARAHR